MGRTRWTVIALFVAIAGSGCSLLVSLDDLSNGSADGPDASNDAGDANAPITDSGSKPDGNVILFDSGSVFCDDAGGFLHCDNFDDDASIATRNPQSQFGVVELDSDFILSPPLALHVIQSTIDAGILAAGTSSKGNFIVWNATTSPNFIRVNFDFFTQQEPAAGKGVEMARIHIANLGWLDFVPSISTIQINEMNDPGGNTFTGPSIPFAPEDGNWHHVEMILDMTGTVSKMSLAIDGQAVATQVQTTLTWKTGTTSVILGTRGQTAPGTPVRGRYDNFTVAGQ